jgi:hypothetical protein
VAEDAGGRRRHETVRFAATSTMLPQPRRRVWRVSPHSRLALDATAASVADFAWRVGLPPRDGEKPILLPLGARRRELRGSRDGRQRDGGVPIEAEDVGEPVGIGGCDTRCKDACFAKRKVLRSGQAIAPEHPELGQLCRDAELKPQQQISLEIGEVVAVDELEHAQRRR